MNTSKTNMLNPKNTFASFVVCGGNDFACATARTVANTPGKAFNPLFLHGDTGLGKTHLLHAIGLHIARQRKGARVVCLSAETLAGECIAAIQDNRLQAFRDKYRHIDVLLIDDLHFLVGKDPIQEELFHTFNYLIGAGRQIVLACNCPPARCLPPKFKALEQRLVSRFEWGQVASVEAPDAETRLAILEQKTRSMDVHLPANILHFLANRIRSNVRRLEGAMIHVASYAALTGKTLTVNRVENLLRDILRDEGRVA